MRMDILPEYISKIYSGFLRFQAIFTNPFYPIKNP